MVFLQPMEGKAVRKALRIGLDGGTSSITGVPRRVCLCSHQKSEEHGTRGCS